jgi:hypothetical protein
MRAKSPLSNKSPEVSCIAFTAVVPGSSTASLSVLTWYLRLYLPLTDGSAAAPAPLPPPAA